jgi:primosomal protein N' (replication factor Y)
MVTKGLHFDDVRLVAVLNADPILNQPDFRAYERAYQMLEQVSGRAGRMHKRGEVVIQTYQPENPLFTQLANHNYDGFYQEQINERLLFRYPPYHRLINIILKHKDEHTVTQSANSLANNLQQVFGRRCSSTITPIIGRVQSLYVRHILIRIERSASITKAKQIIQTQIQHLHQQETHKNVTIFLDIDPM